MVDGDELPLATLAVAAHQNVAAIAVSIAKAQVLQAAA
jgi:hypothetical protein